MKYKKKPVTIEAFQFDGDLKGSDGKYYVPEWAVKAFEEGILYFDALTPDTPPIELFIKTLEGTMHVPVGSYVIQGVRGEIYCCKEDIFLETYEPVILKTCPICDQSVTINEYISDYLYSINCECCGLKTRRFRSKQNLIKYWNATKSEQAMCYLQKDVQLCQNLK